MDVPNQVDDSFNIENIYELDNQQESNIYNNNINIGDTLIIFLKDEKIIGEIIEFAVLIKIKL